MPRHCSDCSQFRYRCEFSRNQWSKGEGCSRCKSCVNSRSDHACYECGRHFDRVNELKMHMQVHRPRNIPCPVCGNRFFRSGANAVQHVESGYCPACPGSHNARAQIYRFAQCQQSMYPYLAVNQQHLTFGDFVSTPVPPYPYRCNQCGISFRHASQLLQHQDQKHGNARLLHY